jgi:hypothetical protein
MFESLGFMSVAREVAHVDGSRRWSRRTAPAWRAPRSDTPPPGCLPAPPPRTPIASPSALPGSRNGPRGTRSGGDPAARSSSLPARSCRRARFSNHVASGKPSNAGALTSPTHGPFTACRPHQPCQAGQQAGDVDQAISLLNDGVDRCWRERSPRDRRFAGADLVARSDQAAGDADWERAAGSRARARLLRFELKPARSTRPCDARVASSYRRLGPNDISSCATRSGRGPRAHRQRAPRRTSVEVTGARS